MPLQHGAQGRGQRSAMGICGHPLGIWKVVLPAGHDLLTPGQKQGPRQVGQVPAEEERHVSKAARMPPLEVLRRLA